MNLSVIKISNLLAVEIKFASQLFMQICTTKLHLILFGSFMYKINAGRQVCYSSFFKHVLLNNAVNYRAYTASVTDKYGAFVE